MRRRERRPGWERHAALSPSARKRPSGDRVDPFFVRQRRSQRDPREQTPPVTEVTESRFGWRLHSHRHAFLNPAIELHYEAGWFAIRTRARGLLHLLNDDRFEFDREQSIHQR